MNTKAKITTTIRVDSELFTLAKEKSINLGGACEMGIRKMLDIEEKQDQRIEYYEMTTKNTNSIQNLAKKIWELEAEIEKINNRLK